MDLINSIELYESTKLDELKKDRLRVAGKNLVLGVNKDYDRIDVTYPDNVTEVFSYSKESTLVQTITVTYLTSSKKDLSSVEVS